MAATTHGSRMCAKDQGAQHKMKIEKAVVFMDAPEPNHDKGERHNHRWTIGEVRIEKDKDSDGDVKEEIDGRVRSLSNRPDKKKAW